MKRYLILLIAAVAFACTKEVTVPDANDNLQEASVSVNTRAVIVEFSDEMCKLVEEDFGAGKLITKSKALNSAVDELNIVSIERVFPYAGEFEARHREAGLHKVYKIVFADNAGSTKAVDVLGSLSGIVQTEPERQIRPAGPFFNDPQYPLQWEYNDGKKPTAGINVGQVWKEFTTGNSKVIVGVVDTGIDMSHPDLSAACIKGGSDGSKNFCDNSYTIVGEKHGTHVAGTIAALNNNGICVSGIAGGDAKNGVKGVRLLSCQIFQDKKSNGNISSAMVWAADHGAVILNNSWTDVYKTQAEAEAATISFWDKYGINYFIKYAGMDRSTGKQTGPMAGGVVFFSAGNNNWPNATPSSYQNVIAVGATDRNRNKCSFSNYGDWVDIAAPGKEIISTIPGNTYGSMNGTSMACPHVSGIAALLVSYYGGPGFTNERLKEKLLGGANKNGTDPSLKIGPLADAINAFWYGAYPPDKVNDLKLSANGNTIGYNFKITGDSEKTKAYSYVVAASTDKAALRAYDLSAPAPTGIIRDTISTSGHRLAQALAGKITGLGYDKVYYVTVAGYTKDKKFGEKSDIKEIRTAVNNPPVISAEKEGPFVLRANDVINLRYSISDPERHGFTVSFVPGSEAATYEYSSGIVKVRLSGRGAPAGKYTATIKALDDYGATGTFDIEYSILENHPPVVVKGIKDFIAQGKGAEYTFDLSGYFTDDDGDNLSYAAETDVNSAADAHISVNKLTINASGYGYGEVKVTASDDYGGSCSFTFKVYVVNPQDPVILYPNPVVSILNIRAGEARESQIRLISHAGSVVFEKSLTISGLSPVSIDLSGLALGVYTAEINYEGKKYYKKIVKK